ncbi:MAG: PAS-domain containing protein [Alphaproteobacteria bacterium]|nr:PAS-domain containing protein [Alphaproteobacteria bacterium]
MGDIAESASAAASGPPPERAAESRLPSGATLAARGLQVVRGWAALAALTCGAVIGIASITTYQIIEARGRVENETVGRLGALCESLAWSVAQTATATDIALQDIAESLAQAGPQAFAFPGALRSQLRRRLSGLPQVRALIVLDRDGKLRADSDSDAGRPIDMSDRDYFQHGIARLKAPFIGVPQVGRDVGGIYLPFARAILGADDDFLGTVVALLDPGYFDERLGAIDVGPVGTLAIWREDGRLIQRRPAVPDLTGRSFTAGPLYAALQRGERQGVIRSVSSPLDDVQRMLRFRDVPGYPLVVSVSAGESDYLATWRRDAREQGLIAGIGALAVGALGLSLAAQLRRREREERRLAERERRYDLALQGANDGVWEWDIATDAAYFSPTWMKIMGHQDAPLPQLISSWTMTVHPDDLARCQAIGRDYLAGRLASYEITYRARHRTRGWIWVTARGQAVRDATGAPRTLVGTISDISERRAAEERLLEGERRFKDYAEASADWFWETDADHRFVVISDNMERLTGIPPQQVIGKSRRAFGEATSRTSPAWARHMDDLSARRPFRDFRYPVRVPGGGERWLSSSGKPLFAPDGSFAGYRGTGRDVTAEIEAAQELQRLEQRLIDAIDSFGDGFALWSPDDRLLMHNKGHRDLMGGAGPLIRAGMSFEQVLRLVVGHGGVESSDAEDVDAFVAKRLAQHRKAEGTAALTLSGGRHVLVREQRTSDGGIIGIYADVTGLKSAEQRLRDVIETMPAAVMLFDPDDRFVMGNRENFRQVPALERIVAPGVTFESMLRGLIAGGILKIDAAERETWVAQRLARHRLGEGSTRVDHVTGRTVEVHEARLADGSIILVRFDVTDHVRRERELAAARDLAESSNRAKSVFLSTMSHELRTPLHAVIGFAQILERELAGPDGAVRQRDFAREIRESGELLLSIINDVLDLSRVESGGLKLDIEDVDVAELAASAARMLRPRAQGRRVEIALGEGLAAPLVWRADAQRLKQVLLNLVANAVKFTPEGGRIEVRARRRDDGALAVAVADTGIGMTPDEIERALRPFEQIHQGFDRSYAGAGLGLPLAKALVELHGGQLQVVSAKGSGSTVTLLLPQGA